MFSSLVKPDEAFDRGSLDCCRRIGDPSISGALTVLSCHVWSLRGWILTIRNCLCHHARQTFLCSLGELRSNYQNSLYITRCFALFSSVVFKIRIIFSEAIFERAPVGLWPCYWVTPGPRSTTPQPSISHLRTKRAAHKTIKVYKNWSTKERSLSLRGIFRSRVTDEGTEWSSVYLRGPFSGYICKRKNKKKPIRNVVQ